MANLKDLLAQTTNESLKSSLKLLSVKPTGTRKLELIDELLNALSGTKLKELFLTFSKVEKAAIAEAVYSPDHLFDPRKVEAQLGIAPTLRKPAEGPHSWTHRGDPTTLSVLFFYDSDQRAHFLPDDLALAFSKFVTKPSPLKVKAMDNPTEEAALYQRQTEAESMNEIYLEQSSYS